MNDEDFIPNTEEYINPIIKEVEEIDPNQEGSLLKEIHNEIKNFESFKNKLRLENLKSKNHLKIFILQNFAQLILFFVISIILLIQTLILSFLIFSIISFFIIILSVILLHHYYKSNKFFPVIFNIRFLSEFNLDVIYKPLSNVEATLNKIKLELEALPKKLDNDFDKFIYKSNMTQIIALNKQYMFFDELRNSSEIRLEFLNKGYAYILKLKNFLENYNISLNENHYQLLLENLEKEIKHRDYQEFFHIITQRVANLTSIDEDVLNFLFKTHNGLDNQNLWNKVKNSDSKLENLSQNLIKADFFQNYKIKIEDLTFILNLISEFNLFVIKSFTKLFSSFSTKINKISEYLELLKIRTDHRIMFAEIINSNKILKTDFNMSIAILKELFLLKSKENDDIIIYNEDFFQILGFLVGRDYFNEIFKYYCIKIAKNKNLTIILWKILKSFENNSKSFILEYQMNKIPLVQFINDKFKELSYKVEDHIISIFQEKLQSGIIILDENRLFSEYYRNMKEGSDIIENIFSKFGDIDFKYLLNAVFSKLVSINHFLKIFSSVVPKNYSPFLLTFDNIQNYVDEILDELQNKRKIYWTQYTHSTRIGIASKEFKDLKNLRNYFEEGIDRRLVKNMPQDDYESKFDFVLKRMWEAVMEAKKTENKNYEILEKIYYDSVGIKDYNQRKKLFDSLKRFLEYNKYPGAENLIEDFLKPFHIMIYQLLSDDDGIHRIESSEKYSPLSKIKERYARKIEDTRTMNIGISMDRDFKDINFYQIFERYLETASFEDLLLPEFEIFSEVKSKIAKQEKGKGDPKLKSIIELSFGETGTNNYLKKEMPGINNLKELSDKISQKFTLETDWNRELYKKNITNIEALLGKFIKKLSDFWEIQIPKKMREENSLLKKLFIKRIEMSRRIFHYLLYIKLVISRELFLEDLTSSKEKADIIWEKLQSFLGTELHSKLKNDPDFEELFIRTIQLIETFMEYPIYRMVKKAEYQLDITKLEKHFQYRFYEHYRRFFNHKITMEPEVQDNRMDLLLKNYPIEIKMRTKKDKSWKEFINRWLGQISHYCTTRNADVGLLIIYDNVENYDPANFLIDFFDFKEGHVLNEENKKGIQKPKIIIIRVPNFVVTPRDKK